MPSSDRSRGRMSAALAKSVHSGSGLQLQRELRREEAAEDEARQLIAATRGSGQIGPSEVTHAVDADHALLHATTNEVLVSPPPTDPCGHVSVFYSARLLNVQVPQPAPARTLPELSSQALVRGRSPGDHPRWPAVSPAGPHRPSSQRAPIQTNPDLGRIPADLYEHCNLLQRSDS
jgi:hypothetical protein